MKFFSAMLVCTFSCLPNNERSNLFVVAALSSKCFSGKTSLLGKDLYLLTPPDDKVKFAVVCLSIYYGV